jgi:Fe-S-cluster containining protein
MYSYTMHPWMEKHREFLKEVESWYGRIRAAHEDRMECGRGCSRCCHGLFDISIADALLVAGAFAALAPESKAAVQRSALEIEGRISSTAPDLPPPYLLDVLTEEKIDAIVDAAQAPPCVFLGTGGKCRIYASRPLACRIEGIPMVDTRDGLFGDWCELNFTTGVPESALKDLAYDYCELQNVEDVAAGVVAEEVGRKWQRTTVFMASIVSAFESF